MEPFMWWILVVYVVVTVIVGFTYIYGDSCEQHDAVKLLAGLWGGSAVVVISVFAMTFVVKPVLNWLITLVF